MGRFINQSAVCMFGPKLNKVGKCTKVIFILNYSGIRNGFDRKNNNNNSCLLLSI